MLNTSALPQSRTIPFNFKKISVNRVRPRYIMVDELCRKNLSLHAMAVYQTLRFESDYSKECDEVEMSVSTIAQESKISERKVYHALNELEFEHYLIQRINYHHYKYGKKNCFNVARDYYWFKQFDQDNLQIDQPSYTPARNDMAAQSQNTPAPYAVTPAQNDIPNDHYSFQSINNPIVPLTEPPIFESKSPPADCVNGFSLFWEKWPIKQNKKYAFKIWQKLKLDKIADEIIKHVERMILEDDRWKQGYIPNASTYLNGERWLDEPFRKQSTDPLSNNLHVNTKSDYHNNRANRTKYLHNAQYNDTTPEVIAAKTIKSSFTPEERTRLDNFKHVLKYPQSKSGFFPTDEEYREAKLLYRKAQTLWESSVVEESENARAKQTTPISQLLKQMPQPRMN